MSATPHPPADFAPDSHCSSCGAPYGVGNSGWPRTCAVCGGVAYRNPLPVAVALQPVYDDRGTALVVITRTIAPARGGIALPGGFIDHREDWRHAVARELKEETGIDVGGRAGGRAHPQRSAPPPPQLFGLLPERPAAELPPSAATDETEGWHLLRRPTELAFPLHTLAARAWFEGRYI
ncbi:NUDIX domain-containing protein [Streptomyces mirabilis]|uniref:NUDIX domain-containing protein n=1 Tax=Streptomyces mirabilis TaxID=68239 RepID=UPI003688F29D